MHWGFLGIACVFEVILAFSSNAAHGYTVWVGIGSIGTVVFGAITFDESISSLKVPCLALIIGGIIGLKLADGASAKAEQSA